MATHRYLFRISRRFNVETNRLVTNSRKGGSHGLHRIIHPRFIHADSNPHQLERKDRLSLTENCVKKLNSVASGGEMLRITVEGGGCSGFMYKFTLDKEVKTDDLVFQKDGAKVVVDSLSLGFLEGAKVDYQEELIKSSFLIKDNPNSEQGCSCGTSFSVK